MTTTPPSAPKTKELIRPIPWDWWLKKPAYTWFMVRDVTSVFIAGYCVFLIYLMYRANHADTFASFYQSLAHPVSVVLHLIALAFAVIHSITFFNLTPRVIVMHRGDEKVPESAIAGGHYVMWVVVSLVLFVIAFLVV
jgi:fumarate reductase subunit C